MEIVDSFFIEYPVSLALVDISGNGKYFLLYSLEGHVLVADMSGDVLTDVNCIGPDPTQIGQRVNSLGFLTDSSFVVCGSTGYRTFDFEGKMIESKSDNTIYITKTAEKLYTDTIEERLFIIHPYMEYPPYDGSFYSGREEIDMREFRAVTFFDYANDSSTVLLNIPESEVQFINDFRRLFRYIISVDKQKNQISIIFNPLPKLFIYQYSDSLWKMNTLELVKTIDLSVEHLGRPSLFPDDVMKELMVNGKFVNILKGDSLQIITYLSPLSMDQYSGSSDVNEIMKEMSELQRMYLLVVRNGELIFSDIPVPKKIGYVAALISEDRLICHPSIHVKEYTDREMFFICRLDTISN